MAQISRASFKLFIFLAIIAFLDYSLGTMCEVFLGNVKGTPFYEIRIKEFYKHSLNIDLLFLGSSHAYRSFNPFIFDSAMNLNSFNLGSSGQNPTTAYYLLKEAMRMGHKIRVIVIESYFVTLMGKKTDYDSASYVFHAMQWSKNKYEMFQGSFEFPSSLKLLSKLFKNRYLIERYGESLLSGKMLFTDMEDHYFGKGYVENQSIVSYAKPVSNDLKNLEVDLNPYRLQYLEQTIMLALKNNIRVVLVSAPIAPRAYSELQVYHEIFEIIKKIAGKHEVEYIDYNIINENSRMFYDANFIDNHHLNKSGVKILNKDLCQRLDNIL